mgnify:CR=1 FL=1
MFTIAKLQSLVLSAIAALFVSAVVVTATVGPVPPIV